jgi:hypothetical protein
MHEQGTDRERGGQAGAGTIAQHRGLPQGGGGKQVKYGREQGQHRSNVVRPAMPAGRDDDCTGTPSREAGLSAVAALSL